MRNKIFNEDCVEGIKRIPSNSIDAILTDPPYLYLKNQKLDKEFDEDTLFKEWMRVLKDDGMIAVFGRGVPCARWLVKLDEIGFKHKEDMVWNKYYCPTPALAVSRCSENFYILAKGKGKVIKSKVPYLQMRGHDLASMQQDINRLCSAFSNPESFEAVKKFLEYNDKGYGGKHITGIAQQGGHDVMNRCSATANSIKNGMNEKSIINDYDYFSSERKYKFNVVAGDGLKNGNRCVYVAKGMGKGMNEKSIIKEQRDHYDTIHPTQKPVSLLVRILNLISRKGDTILDCFSGSGSTAVACMKSGRDFIGFELDKEYYDKSIERIHGERDLFTF